MTELFFKDIFDGVSVLHMVEEERECVREREQRRRREKWRKKMVVW